MFGLVELGFGGGGGVIFVFSSGWVNPRLHTENQLSIMLGSALKVCVGGWWVSGWVVLKVNLVIALA